MLNRVKVYLLTIFAVFCTVIFFYFTGCCSKGGGSGIIVNASYPAAEIVYRDVVIDERGQLPMALFPSGATVKATNDMTLQPGIKVVLAEQTVTADTPNMFSESLKSSVSVYKITAIMKSDEMLVPDMAVTTLEKPFIVTVPNRQNETGICYVGVREDETCPWRFFPASDSNNISGSFASLRTSDDVSKPEYIFEQYRLGTNFAICSFDSNLSNFGKLPETVVNSLIATAPSKILVKDGKYQDNLMITGVIKGFNLASLKPYNLFARITYRNNSEETAKIKADGVLCQQTTAYDKTVPGKSYVHSFIIYNINKDSFMSSEGYFGFKLNLKDLDVEMFPSEFLVEFCNKIESEKILPFIYTQFINIEKNENVSLALNSDSGNQILPDTSLFRCNPTFSISSDYALPDNYKAKIASAVRIIKVNPEVASDSLAALATTTEAIEEKEPEYVTEGINKAWQGNSLVLSFDRNLEGDTIYWILLSEVDDKEGITIIPFEDFTFKTVGDAVFYIAPDENSLIADASNTYRLLPTFYITTDYKGFTADDWSKIAESVSVASLTEGIASITYSQGSITVKFAQKLTADSEYTISMGGVKEIGGVNAVPFSDFTFETETYKPLNFTITSDADNVFVAGPPELYHCRPKFTVTPSLTLSDLDKTIIEESISIDNNGSSIITKNWDNNELKIGFSSDLNSNATYTISMTAVDDIEGFFVTPFENKTFTTIDGMNIAITSDEGSVFVIENGKELYHTLPIFTVTANMGLNEENKTKIANAISISNVADDKVTKNWVNDTTLKISFVENLAQDTAYTFSIEKIDDINGVSVYGFAPYSFTTMKALCFAVIPDADNIYTAMDPKYHCRPGFTIEPNYSLSSLSEASKSVLLNAVTVSDSNGLIKAWDGSNIRVTFSSNLSPDSAHTLAMNAVNSITGVTVTPFDSFEFTTVATLTFTLTPGDSNVFDAGPPELYRCKPVFTVTPAFTLNDTDKTLIENAVTIDSNGNAKMTKTWEGNVLKIAFSSNLSHSTVYTLSMSAVDGIKGVETAPFESKTFTTVEGINVVIASDNGNVFITENETSLYHTLPTFTVTTNMVLSDSGKTAISDAISVSNVDSNKISKIWSDDTTLNISFTENLTHDTSYTISMSAVADLNDFSVSSFDDFDFTTMKALTIELAEPADNIFVTSPSELYHCRPSFTITPNYSLNNADKTKIENAITVSNANNITKLWNNNVLTVAFSSDLEFNSAHTLSMSAVNDITGVTVIPFADKSFTAMGAVTFTVTPDDTNVYAAMGTLYRCNPGFKISPNYILSDAVKSLIADAVSVTGSTVTLKNWNDNDLRVTFSSNLTPNSDYTLTMAAVNSITGVTVNSFSPQNFTTVDTLSFTLESPDSNVFVTGPPALYHCRPIFTLTPSFNLNAEDKIIIANAVTISSNGNLMSKNWNGNNLEISFSGDLPTSTEYTLSMNAVTSISGVFVTPVTQKTFTTIGGLNISIVSDSGDVFTVFEGNGLYHTLPTFTVTSNMALSAVDQAKIAGAISVSNVDNNKITKSWANGTTLNISFTENLNLNTDYTVSMADVDNISGVSVGKFADFNFRTMDALSFTVTPDNSNVYAALGSKYRCNPAFTITPNYSLSYLSVASKAVLLDAVTVTNSNGLTKAWNGDNIRVTFDSDLLPDTSHTLAMNAAVGFTGISVSTFDPVAFTTVPTLDFELTSPNSNVFVVGPPELYHCRPVFTLRPSFSLNAEDKTIIANAVTISNGGNLMSKNWNGNNLEISFSGDLPTSTEYTLSMNAVTSISGVSVTPVTQKTFTTIDGLNISIASDNGNVFVTQAGNDLYQTLPTFTVTSNMALSAADQTKIANAISVSNVDDSKITKSWANGTTLNISFTENLNHNTAYTVAMADVNNINGVTVSEFADFSFKTMEVLSFALADAVGNVFISSPSELYHCRPSFSITPKYSLNDADKTKIENAITVSNADNVTKSWNNNVLTVAFSSNLALNSAHTISMSAVNDITGVTVNSFADKSFTTMGAVTFTVTPDDTNVYAAMGTLYRCNPGFTITPNYTLSESAKSIIADAVSVTGSTVTSKNWSDNELRVTFSSSLTPNSDYTLTMAAVNSITGVTVNSFSPKDFTTVDTLSFALDSPDSNVFVIGPPALYHCRPMFTLTPSFNLNAEDKTIIANAVAISSNGNLMSKNWNGNNLEISFSSDIAESTNYTLSMNAVSISGVSVTPLTSKTFTTIGGLNVNIASDNGNVFVTQAGNDLYHTLPTFTVTTNMALGSDDQDKIAGAISVSNVDNNKITKNWANGTTLNISFTENLTHNTAYTISMSAVSNINGVTVNGFSNFSFRTMEALSIALADAAGNVFVSSPSELYRCRPSFIVTPNYALNDDNKAKIENAVTVSNANNITKSWNNNVLTVAFSSDLALNSAHTVSMSAVNDITGVRVTPFDNKNFTTMGALTFEAISAASNVYAALDPLYRCNPTFTISSNYSLDSLSNTEKAAIVNSITLSNSGGITKTWDGNNLIITMSSNLAPNSAHTLSMAAVNSITGVTVSRFDSLEFNTVPVLTFTLTSEAENIFVAGPPELYHCRPVFTITPGFTLNEEDKSIIANAVALSSNGNLMTKNWSGNNLEISFSSNLTTNTQYTISMNAVTSISGVSVTPCTSKTFTTIEGLNVRIASDSGDVFAIVNGNGLYHTLPTFTVTTNMALSDTDQSKIASAISVSNVADNKINKNWANGTTLNISFAENLTHNTAYTISIAEVNNINGVPVNGFSNLGFRTMEALSIELNDAAGNVFVSSPSELYQCRPSFTITPKYSLNDANKAKIENAVTVSNANNITKSWNNNVLTVSFGSDLALNSAHTVSMSAVNDITGVTVTPFANKNFTTMDAISFTVIPDASNVYEAMSPNYHCKPAFTIRPNYDLSYLSTASKSVLLNAVAVSSSSGLTKAWDGNDMRITFTSKQTSGNHSLTMAAVNSFTGITVTPFTSYGFTVLDTLTFAVATASTDVYEAMSPKYRLNPTFTITPSFTLNEEDKPKIANAVSVSNTSSIISKVWNNNNLVITFSQYLNPNTSYTLSMGNISGMDNLRITKFSNKAFTTLPVLSFTLTKDSDNVFYSGKYHCRPGFTITPSFTVNNDDKSAIANAVAVSNVSNSIIDKTWNGNVMTLVFNQNIATSTDFTLSMPTTDYISGVSITPFSSFAFSTIPDLIVKIATSSATLVKKAGSSNVLDVKGNTYCYCSGSSFTLSTNMTLNQTNKDKIFNAIYLTGIDSSLVNKSWSGNNIAVSFNNSLTASTTFSFLISEINDIKGVTVRIASPSSFTTFFHQGKGTQADPFTIYTPAQLACLDYYSEQAYYYKQMENLDLSSFANWEPIGSNTSDLGFKGKYNGNNKKISNAVINRPDEDYVGLFTYTYNSVFSDLSLENISVNGKDYCGGLSGYLEYTNNTNINVSNSVVYGKKNIGGICGYSKNAKLSNTVISDVTASGTQYVGGVSGYGYYNTEIYDVEADSIKIFGGKYIGNIVGNAFVAKIQRCNISNSMASGTQDVGGVCGNLDYQTLISDIESDSLKVFGETNIGNVVGELFSSNIENCRITNSLASGTSSVGGVCGNVRYNSVVSDIEVDHMTAYGKYYIGCALGKLDKSTLEGCQVTNSIASGSSFRVGGCVGEVLNTSVVSDLEVNNTKVYGDNLTGCAFGVFDKSNIENCRITNSLAFVKTRQVGGFAGCVDKNCNITKIICDNVNVEGSYRVGGFIGETGKSINIINKSLIKDSYIKGSGQCVGGFVGELASATLDSCYITGCNIVISGSNGSIGGLIGSNSSNISNCYIYNTTVTGVTNYGAIIGTNNTDSIAPVISDCFVSQNRNILINTNNSNAPVNCYYNVNALGTFNGKTWSDGAWSNFNTSVFPPQLTDLPEP